MFGNAGLRIIVDLLIFLAAGVAGGIIGYLLMKSRQLQTRNEAEALLVNAQAESKRIVAEAESRAKTIALSAQEQKVQILEESENEVGAGAARWTTPRNASSAARRRWTANWNR